MLKSFSFAKWGTAILLLSSLSSCEDILEQYFPKPTPPPTIPTFPSLGLDIPFYALSGGNKLDAYSTKDPATRTASVAITGLASGETLLAIDFRPATGQLYGISSASRLYIINQNTGAARAIGSGAFTPAVAGNLVGFDFNPTVDRIRLVTSTGQNLRLSPETGAVVAIDGSLNGAAGAQITSAAYTNNTNGVSTTALYAINVQNQQLYLVNPPNDGMLEPIGSLNLDVSGNGGFDIDAKTGTALGLYTVNGKPTLFTVDLTTGATQTLAEYAANLSYSSIAIPTQPVAYLLNTQRDIRGREQFNLLYIIDPTATSDSRIQKSISGLDGQEAVAGIDFRPSTGQLYLLTSASRLYTLNPATGQATLAATLNTPLEASSEYGFDFNPVADRLRIVSRSGQNLRVSPVDGVAIADGRINPSTAGIVAAAYDNNFAGATVTSLYVTDINVSDSFNSKLYLQNPPNAGVVTEIANLGTSIAHLDIGGMTNTAYAFHGSGNTSMVYTINLTTGALTPLRRFAGPAIFGFAVGLGF